MDQTNMSRLATHPAHEIDQRLLVSMGRISSQRVHPSANRIPLTIQLHIPTARPIALDHSARRPGRLIADEHDIRRRITGERLQVVDHTTSGTHTTGRQHRYRQPGRLRVRVPQRDIDPRVLRHWDYTCSQHGEEAPDHPASNRFCHARDDSLAVLRVDAFDEEATDGHVVEIPVDESVQSIAR